VIDGLLEGVHAGDQVLAEALTPVLDGGGDAVSIEWSCWAVEAGMMAEGGRRDGRGRGAGAVVGAGGAWAEKELMRRGSMTEDSGPL
jgi:hypothetical protein